MARVHDSQLSIDHANILLNHAHILLNILLNQADFLINSIFWGSSISGGAGEHSSGGIPKAPSAVSSVVSMNFLVSSLSAIGTNLNTRKE